MVKLEVEEAEEAEEELGACFATLVSLVSFRPFLLLRELSWFSGPERPCSFVSLVGFLALDVALLAPAWA